MKSSLCIISHDLNITTDIIHRYKYRIGCEGSLTVTSDSPALIGWSGWLSRVLFLTHCSLCVFSWNWVLGQRGALIEEDRFLAHEYLSGCSPLVAKTSKEAPKYQCLYGGFHRVFHSIYNNIVLFLCTRIMFWRCEVLFELRLNWWEVVAITKNEKWLQIRKNIKWKVLEQILYVCFWSRMKVVCRACTVLRD